MGREDDWWEDVIENQPWAIWCPDLEGWYPFGADLAAKYSAQGCLVRLVGSADELDALPIPAGRLPEPNPDAPPFSPQDIVWNERAARFCAASYGQRWEAVRKWLEQTANRAPLEVVKQWRRVLGEWGGGANLVKMDSGDDQFRKPVPLFDQDLYPF